MSAAIDVAASSLAGLDAPTVTVVVPTRNEAGNVAPLVSRLGAALRSYPPGTVEILFVDDSTDDTPDRIREVAVSAPRPVRLIHRAAGQRVGGLGGAVVAGLRASRTDWVIVMDGDLQHPPETVPELVAAGEEGGADIVVASRYVGAGDASGLGSVARTAVSRGSTHLTRAVFPRRLARCTDPMSGFFAVRRSSIRVDDLRPSGFKILLEIVARSRPLRVDEVAFTFADRHSGDSKAGWREGLLFGRRLVSLRLATLVGAPTGRLGGMAGFALVGLTGVGVNTLALWLLVHLAGAPVALAATGATQCSTLWNFALIDRYVYPGPKPRPAWQRLLGFAVVNNVALLARLPLLAWLIRSAGMHYLLANVLTLLGVFAVRYLISDRFLFTRGGKMTATLPKASGSDTSSAPEGTDPCDGAPRRFGPVDLVVDMTDGAGPRIRRRPATRTHFYDVHGIVTIGSAIALPELTHFAAEPAGEPDIDIAVGSFAPARVRGRTQVTQFASRPAVSYREHLGRAGSDVYIDMTDRVQITVGPLLARSPHVLYTNVVEALLRFVLVSRGYMLLHSACLDFDGHGVLLSALTDTGKTGTVLKLLREHGGRFLSDDMTIIDGKGRALCYPKPLTISQHTLRAVNAGDLSAREWRRLRVQSRVHSKEGRGIGARLGEINLPIMSINAITQRVIPPPKYTVQRLVPCEMGVSVDIENLFVIERAPYRLDEIEPDGLIDELIANTDDAYGFPPFRYLAPAFVVGGEEYEELRARERAILVSAMTGIRARRLATPDFTWCDHIPSLVRTGTGSTAPVTAE
ncbi:MAG TPA: glycosyltransferase [Jatrophihabitans sp.]|uniref:glycosyltransferase n=1 Tax=Jatrophihabitans sp. TaxID=1932789 RepID=UPI002DFF84D3|nr:glycosyltransferase [Jatrophihabitans sp.]